MQQSWNFVPRFSPRVSTHRERRQRILVSDTPFGLNAIANSSTPPLGPPTVFINVVTCIASF